MGDRTFSAEDVLRIYEFFLDSDEQETVEKFFAEMEEEEEPEESLPSPDDFFRLLGLFRQLLTPLRAVAVFIQRFPFFIAAASVIQFVVERVDIFIDELLNRGVIDA